MLRQFVTDPQSVAGKDGSQFCNQFFHPVKTSILSLLSLMNQLLLIPSECFIGSNGELIRDG